MNGTNMDLALLIKARLSIVRRDLDEVLGRLSQDLLAWAPKDGMRTISGQLVEIAVTELQVVACLQGNCNLSFEELSRTIGNNDSLEELKQALVSVRRRTLDYIESFTSGELEEQVSVPIEWFESLGLPAAPRSEVFRGIAQHEWYHVGQLVSYLWSKGDDPYKW